METNLRVLEEEHPFTLINITNIELTYRNQKQWKEAKELEMQVI